SLTVRQTEPGTRRESPEVTFVRFALDTEPPHGTGHLLDAPHRADLDRSPGVSRPGPGRTSPTGPRAGSGHPALETPAQRRGRLAGHQVGAEDRPAPKGGQVRGGHRARP